ncbi:helix-turn-helix transcriptional regulator, partial [Candidatus Sumerlaeota bacterium]|nr:helix-turn-helix transcriptional regulator [Candidatus Sumerlaeota bacterium]
MTNNGSRFETGERLIIGDQMRKARQMLAIAPSETAQHLGVSEAGLLAWEQERAAPTLTQLEALGGLYGRSLDYFLRHTPPAPDHIEFRSTSRLSFGSLSAQARLALARFDELCRAAFELEQLLGKHRPPPRPTPSELPAPQLARERRAALGLPDGPIRDLLDRLVGVGIRVFQLPVPGDAFSGFSYWHSDYGP